MENPIIVLTGPTASGKTAISFEVAKKFNVEVVAADSMTVYKGMDIGTDKPTLLDNKTTKKDGIYVINGVRHHLLDVIDPNEEMNVSIFKELAEKAIKRIRKNGNIPLIVGGSTLYIDALAYDFKMPKIEPDENLRKKLEQNSTEELFNQLVELDPDCEWTIDKNNKRRLIRALEVVMKTGEPFCGQKSKSSLPENILYLSVEKNREELYQKINRRVDEMMNEGFLDEVRSLYKKYDHNTAMQAAGYRQLIQYLDGKITLEEAVEKTKQVHRNFAKRQITWLKRNTDILWIKTPNEAARAIKEFLNKN